MSFSAGESTVSTQRVVLRTISPNPVLTRCTAMGHAAPLRLAAESGRNVPLPEGCCQEVLRHLASPAPRLPYCGPKLTLFARRRPIPGPGRVDSAPLTKKVRESSSELHQMNCIKRAEASVERAILSVTLPSWSIKAQAQFIRRSKGSGGRFRALSG